MNRKESEENKQPNRKDIISACSVNELRMVGCCHCKTNHVESRDNIFEEDLKAFEQKVCDVVIDQYLPCLETNSPNTIDGMSYSRPGTTRLGFDPSNSLIKLTKISQQHRDVDDMNGCNNDGPGTITSHKRTKRCYKCRMNRLQRIIDDAIAITTEVHQIMVTKEELSQNKSLS